MFLQNLHLLNLLVPVIAAPLVIHLLNKRFPKWMPFSSVELIRKSMAQRGKFMRWRHWLLTLVRTLLVGLIVLAFLQPMMARFGQQAQSGQKRHVVIVLDHSASMEVTDGLATLRTRASGEASRILDALGAEDQVNVVAAERSARTAFTGWSGNHTAARAFITGLGPGYERADFHKAVDATAALIQEVSGTAEVYFISDFQRTNWSDASFAGLPERTRLFFVGVGEKDAVRENRAVTQVEVTSGALLAGGEITLQVQVANHSAAALNEPLEAVVDGRDTYEVQATAAPWSVQRLTLVMRAPAPGWHPVVVRLKQADALPLDDAFHLPLQITEREEVVIITEDSRAGSADALTQRFLEAAINPYADARGSLQPRVIAASSLQPASLAATSKVVLTQTGKLNELQTRTLADFMKSGGGVLYFLDGPFDRENLDAFREWFGQAEAVPLRLTARQAADTGGSDMGSQIAKGRFESPWLRLFRGASREALAQLSFYERWHAAPVERGEILMTYADGTPAMAVGHPGLGTLAVCNFSVAEVASNIARQRLFPAWIQELVAQLSGDHMAAPRFEPGDMMQAEVWTKEAREMEFVGPAGLPVIGSKTDEAGRLQMLVPAKEPGTYTLGAPGKKPLALLAANMSPAESDLRGLEMAITPQQAQADGATQAHGLGSGTDYREVAHGRAVFHWALWAALGMLLLETLLQFTVRRKAAASAS